MVDLSEFTGEDALRVSLQKKRAAAQAKLDETIAKAQLKIAPLQAKVEKLDALLEVLDTGKRTEVRDDNVATDDEIKPDQE